MTFHDLKLLLLQLKKEWLDTCCEELNDLCRHNVYELVELPHGQKAIQNKWVFLIKSTQRQCVQLVAKGYSQIEDIDYDKIFSPVVYYETVRITFRLAALEGMYMTGFNVKAAFLYGKLDEEIYMKQPEGFALKGQENLVLKLKKALYKQH